MTLTLQKYVLAEIIKAFLLAIIAITLMLFLGTSVQFWQGRGLSFTQLLLAMPYLYPMALEYGLPVSILIATTLVYGKLAQNNEILAIRSGGIHLWHIIVPTLILGIALSGVSFYLNNSLIPQCRFKRVDIIRQNLGEIFKNFISRGETEIGNYKMNIDGVKYNNLYNLTIREFDDEDNLKMIVTAERATYEVKEDKIVFNLIGGRMEKYNPETRSFDVMADLGPTYEHEIDFANYFLKERQNKDEKEMTTWTLFGKVARNDQNRTKYLIEINKRFAMSLSCLVFVLIGVPMGIFLKKGHILSSFAISALPIFGLYYPLLLLGEALSEKKGLNPMYTMWTGDIVLIIVGVVLLFKLFRR